MPNETHNAHIAVDPRLEEQYIRAYFNEAWPYKEPFPVDIRLAKYYLVSGEGGPS